MRYHAHFSGARSPPVTWRVSIKNCTMSCILVTNFSLLHVSFCTSTPVGSMSELSCVAPHVVSSTNESPGLICSSIPSTATNLMQSKLSPNAARNSWLGSAYRIGDAHLPWPISTLLDEELYSQQFV
jgi:hypothetical protein